MSDFDKTGLTAGQKVGAERYTLIRELGKGGMGVVWLAQDGHLREEVALKFLPAQVQQDEEALEGLRRETARAHKLTHANIIRIHDLHSSPGETAFISMEYIQGKTLAELRHDQPGGVFTWSDLAPLALQLCEALAYAHQEGVIHRDLKPSNMMVDQKGRLKLADFGIAAVVCDTVNRVSVQNSRSGTPVYMSPQQMRGETPQVSDDIYAFGASLYHQLTGQPPFYQGDIQHQVIHVPATRLGDRLSEFKLGNNVPEQVAATIMACLSKVPEERPPGLEVIRKQLEPAAEEKQPEGAADGKAKGRRYRVAGVVVALLLVGAGLWYHFGSSTGNDDSGWPEMNSEDEKEFKSSLPSHASKPGGNTRWTNSLGMVFVPVPGIKVMFCIWECRVRDYQTFTVATRRPWKNNRVASPRYANPAVNVSWNDAMAFCEWLTQQEAKSGWLGKGQTYRLPTDAEWSTAVGLPPETGASPRLKSGNIPNLYPWGKEWPPPKGRAGNYSPRLKVDKFSNSSVVGSFLPNAYGLYDMGGNVGEWCMDWFDSNQKERVRRSAAWNISEPAMLLASCRGAAPPGQAGDAVGFRVVLSLEGR
jgi:serine/threonine protein kinase